MMQMKCIHLKAYGVSSKETEPQSNQTYMLDPLVYCEGICKRFIHLIWSRLNVSLCRIYKHLHTAIEEHHHFKAFCYMVFVYNSRHFEFVGNCDFITYHSLHLNILCLKFPCFTYGKQWGSFTFEMTYRP